MTDWDANPHLVERVAFTVGYTAATVMDRDMTFQGFQGLDVYEEDIEPYLVQVASETDQTLADLETSVQQGFEFATGVVGENR